MRTAAGEFVERRGWLLQESREGKNFWGEVAPFPGFAEGPRDWESRIQRWLAEGDPGVLGDSGAVGFGAWCLEQEIPFVVDAKSAGLIQGNGSVEDSLPDSSDQTWKVKIGVKDEREEISRLDRILTGAPAGTKIRLDANQRLTPQSTREWLEWMSDHPEVEFLEQPLPVGREGELLETFCEDAVRLALDESVVGLENLEKARAMEWPGWFVIKPSLFGSPEPLFSLPEELRRRVVVSSAFETGIGFAFVLRIASRLGQSGVAHGLGTRGSFGEDGLDGWSTASQYQGEVSAAFLEEIWNRAS
ncbi:enolase C-terminal domain-like protein [Puniceicoccus vermicola]|uniref:enolase C-terminal domain-like protein n=1 Tax=Puniceicoccus vermicola TaxID=388746 RepID=UPI0033943736